MIVSASALSLLSPTLPKMVGYLPLLVARNTEWTHVERPCSNDARGRRHERHGDLEEPAPKLACAVRLSCGNCPPIATVKVKNLLPGIDYFNFPATIRFGR